MRPGMLTAVTLLTVAAVPRIAGAATADLWCQPNDTTFGATLRIAVRGDMATVVNSGTRIMAPARQEGESYLLALPNGGSIRLLGTSSATWKSSWPNFLRTFRCSTSPPRPRGGDGSDVASSAAAQAVPPEPELSPGAGSTGPGQGPTLPGGDGAGAQGQAAPSGLDALGAPPGLSGFGGASPSGAGGRARSGSASGSQGNAGATAGAQGDAAVGFGESDVPTGIGGNAIGFGSFAGGFGSSSTIGRLGSGGTGGAAQAGAGTSGTTGMGGLVQDSNTPQDPVLPGAQTPFAGQAVDLSGPLDPFAATGGLTTGTAFVPSRAGFGPAGSSTGSLYPGATPLNPVSPSAASTPYPGSGTTGGQYPGTQPVDAFSYPGLQVQTSWPGGLQPQVNVQTNVQGNPQPQVAGQGGAQPTGQTGAGMPPPGQGAMQGQPSTQAGLPGQGYGYPGTESWNTPYPGAGSVNAPYPGTPPQGSSSTGLPYPGTQGYGTPYPGLAPAGPAYRY